MICPPVKSMIFYEKETEKIELVARPDCLQGEYDPPCKYMSDKKMWRYLHMGRSEEEFMRKHNEKMCGHKLPKDKKAEKRKKTAVETAAVDLPSQEELMQVSI